MPPWSLSGVLAVVVGLTSLVSPAAPSDRTKARVSACPTESVPAVIAGKYVCLKQGQACKKLLDGQYRIYGFRCNRARLTRLPNSTILSAIVDVGGYRLAMLCRGTGAPTVVMESGFGWSGWIFSRVQAKLAKTARTCIYDRAGLGVSESRKPPGPVPAARVADDLHALLTGAGIKPPYVLGGWSLGGFFIRLYAKHYPDEVLGLVTLDGTPLGLPPGSPDIVIIGRESFDLGPADVEVAAAPSLGARPLVVVTHGGDPSQDPNEAMWVRFQKQVARLSTSSILVRADTSGHSIASDQPNLTAEAFRQVIAAVRLRGALPVCAATPLPRLHGTCLDPNSP
jgi:alpha/beta hydrolase fold